MPLYLYSPRLFIWQRAREFGTRLCCNDFVFWIFYVETQLCLFFWFLFSLVASLILIASDTNFARSGQFVFGVGGIKLK